MADVSVSLAVSPLSHIEVDQFNTSLHLRHFLEYWLSRFPFRRCLATHHAMQ